MSANNNIKEGGVGLHDAEFLFPDVEESVELSVECLPGEFSASRLARAIEDCDANLLNMNVTSRPGSNGMMTVLLRAAMRNATAAVNALERYGYRVTAVHDAPASGDDVLQDRINDLLTRLNI